MITKCRDECPGDETCENTKWCVCGSAMEDHGIGSGHSPVSMHYYAIHQLNYPEEAKGD